MSWETLLFSKCKYLWNVNFLLKFILIILRTFLVTVVILLQIFLGKWHVFLVASKTNTRWCVLWTTTLRDVYMLLNYVHFYAKLKNQKLIFSILYSFYTYIRTCTKFIVFHAQKRTNVLRPLIITTFFAIFFWRQSFLMEEILIANKLFSPNDFASFFFLKTTEFLGSF